MPIVTNFNVQNLAEAKRGDLVRLDADSYQSALAIVLGLRDGNLEVLPLQQAIDQVEPLTVILPNLGTVANFGSDWILVPADQSSFAAGSHYRSTLGVVHVGLSKTTMPVRHPNNPSRVFHLNLSSWEIDGRDSDAVPIPAWNLWANETERQRIGAKPMMVFDARKLQAAPSGAAPQTP